MKESEKVKKDLTRFLVVFLGAICSGFLLTGLILHYYSPTGRYLVKNVLLSPETVQNVSYPEWDKGLKTQFAFDRITFSYYENQTKNWVHQAITPSKYKSFYEMIAAEKSVEKVNDELDEQFRTAPPARLSIFVHSSKGDSKELLQVQISNDGNYYRIQLRTGVGDNNWAYFYHENIYKKAIEQLIK